MSSLNDPVVIVGAKRTPIGAFQGQFSALGGPRLAASAVAAAVTQAGLQPNRIDEAILGCCLFGGVGQAPARQALLHAGLPDSIPATTISKMCGSGMKASALIHTALAAKNIEFGISGGMESMTNAPYLLARARGGYRLGHGELIDHMLYDGLQDAYEGHLMGYFADLIAQERGISRASQDDFACESVLRAQKAVNEGWLSDEICAVKVPGKEEKVCLVDETPARCQLEKIARLKPAFRDSGSVTAANSSSIADGAAALVMTRESLAVEHGLNPIACIRAHATHARHPSEFSLAPAYAIRRVLDRANWSIADVDLFEINEAFAVVAMLAIAELGLDRERVNVNGGACALGHPIGATGARIVVTLIYALRRLGLKRGVASLCIGGGEAMAMAIEIPDFKK